MKIIGLDVGTRRIGVAVADSNVRIAVPKTTVTVNNGAEYAEIARIARVNTTDFFVVGLPRSNDGNETAQSEYVRGFARALKRAIPDAKIKFQDESLTSVEAEKRLKSRKHGYKREDIDAEAAAIILQDFIENFSAPARSKQSVQPARAESNRSFKPEEKGDTSMLKKLAIGLGVILVIVGIGAGVAFSWYNSALGPVYDLPNCKPEEDSRCEFIDFSVIEGDTLQVIGDNLEAADVVKSSFVFQLYMRTHGLSDKVKVGEYQLQRTMSVSEVGKQLTEGARNPNVFSFTILPGSTIRDIKADLLKVGYKQTEIDAAFSKDYRGTSETIDKLLDGWPGPENEFGAEPLEGYLFGDTYEFYKTDPVEKIITTSMEAMWQVIDGNGLVGKFNDHGLNTYQGITLASIVQRESGTTGQATVAQIFYSRLSQNMILGSDVTTQYALDLIDPNRENTANNDEALDVDSPYNTRRSQGLTPGPICNPGISALLAVGNPADTSYLYFLTGDDGVMYYSYTEDEHNQAIIDHCQELCNVSL